MPVRPPKHTRIAGISTTTAPPSESSPSEARSKNMRAVRSKDTKPEMVVRRLAHALGYRYRLHRRDLPGRPDLVFPARHAVVLVHGCFWHGHDCPKGTKRPATNRAFWDAKLDGNKRRDEANIAALEASGWRVLVLWECEVRKAQTLRASLEVFLGPPRTQSEP